MNNNKISLNFLPINNKSFKFTIWTKLVRDGEKKWDENIKKYKLPDDKGNYIFYWVSLNKVESFSEIEVDSFTNVELSKYYLFFLLKNKIKEVNLQFEQKEKEKSFSPFHIYIITENTKFGKKAIRTEPYFLKTSRKFGFLVDYRFLKNPDINFSKEIQRLSFSLDEHYKNNVNYHIDKFRYITEFLKENLNSFSYLTKEIQIQNIFEQLPTNQLSIRRYLFKNDSEDKSQFMGLMNNGPKQEIREDIRYVYLFNENHKSYVNDLIRALNGEKFKTFEGFEKIGLPKQIKHNTYGISINSFSEKPENFLKEQDLNNSILIAIFPEKEENFYYSLKNYCLQNNIPLQTVHIETLIDENKLKWSISGIALQMFVKLGGVPWLVKESSKNCLIVGIGQSIDRSERIIRKFYSYSILLESTGRFLCFEPLADATTKDEFLQQIGNKVSQILASYNYKKIIFHIPEKTKFDTIKKVEEIIRSNSEKDIEFYILRINDNSKFFGYDLNNNSLIPYESTYVQLSNREFLLWTEGLNYHNTTPRKRYSNPIYIDFYYSNKSEIDYNGLLQDIFNLAGANYRGFNAKALPVSIFYPKLISNFYRHFYKYNLASIIDKKDKMWFL